MKTFVKSLIAVLAFVSVSASANMTFTDPSVNTVFTTNDSWSMVNIRNTSNGNFSNWTVTSCKDDLISADGLRFNVCTYNAPNMPGKTMMILAYENGNHRIMLMNGSVKSYSVLFTD